MANYVVIYVDMSKIAMFTQNEDLWSVFSSAQFEQGMEQCTIDFVSKFRHGLNFDWFSMLILSKKTHTQQEKKLKF